jgi:RNA polymerase sigma-70 factor (ECF subfamily)
MCDNPSDAEDMVQDTFLNVFQYLEGFRYETKFRNWLYRVATSACLKKKRRSKYAPDRELSLDEFLPADESSVSTDLPRWASQPLDQVLDGELASVIREALLDLPEKYRIVVVLRDVEGFSTQETAEILDLTPTNIKVRLHRARLFLREALKSYYESD